MTTYLIPYVDWEDEGRMAVDECPTCSAIVLDLAKHTEAMHS